MKTKIEIVTPTTYMLAMSHLIFASFSFPSLSNNKKISSGWQQNLRTI